MAMHKDCEWTFKYQTQAGKTRSATGRWRAQSFTEQNVPSAPKFQFGRRGTISVKGVYFGNPGLPRSTYPSSTMSPGLGPGQGLGTYRPPRKAEKFDISAGNHLHSTPASFVLEGVVGFNPNTAREIRELRRQLAAVETLYEQKRSDVEHAMKQSETTLQQFREALKDADLKREDLSKLIATGRHQLSGLQPIIDEEAVNVKEERKRLLRTTLGLGQDP